ncbi:MAG: retroviral-like aspartic protease family protein [Nitrospirae bacterium]|nr:retroviral-like aspartic protease family protein [Nitrospirota bacterium]
MPLVEIKLRRGKLQTAPFRALVDTGADYCLFPTDAAVAIGIDPVENEREVPIGGIAGQVKANFHSASIVLGGHEIPCDVGFAQQPFNTCLLGREGFLNNFAVTFDAIRNEITFKSRS